MLNRANARLTIFENEPDHAAFEQVLEQAVERRRARRLGYCLLPQWTASLLLGVQARGASECVLYPRTHLLALRACVFRRDVDLGDRLCATGSASVFVCSCATGSGKGVGCPCATGSASVFVCSCATGSASVFVCHWLCQCSCVRVPLALPVCVRPTGFASAKVADREWAVRHRRVPLAWLGVSMLHWLRQCVCVPLALPVLKLADRSFRRVRLGLWATEWK